MALIIRDARREDAGIIAECVLAAMGFDVYSAEGLEEAVKIGDTELKIADALGIFTQICAREEILYSYTRSRVAEIDGEAAGVLISYPGDENARLRGYTWGLAAAAGENGIPVNVPGEASAEGNDTASDSASDFYKYFPAECEADEYYLDSLAVRPAFRGKSYEYAGSSDRPGHLLLQDGILLGRSKGYTRTSLIVDVTKPNLERYYASLGFRTEGEILFFGHPYHRMVL